MKKIYLFACMVLAIHSMIAFDSRKVFNVKDRESQYLFLEKNFYTDVYAAKNSLWKHIQISIPVVCGVFAGYKYATWTETEVAKELKDSLTAKNLYCTAAALSATIVGIESLQCYIHHYIHRQALAKFLQNWDANRPYTPQELHHVFDALVAIMDIKGNEIVLAQASEIIEVIQFIVMRHFTARYDKVLSIQAIDNLTSTKTILEIIKNSIDINKNFIA